MKYFRCALLCVLVLFLLFPLSACSLDLQTETVSVRENPEAETLYKKLEELSRLKAAAHLHLHRASLSAEDAENFTDSDFTELYLQMESLRKSLLAEGARPSKAMLAELLGKRAAELSADGILDLWGIRREVSAAEESYEIYELFVQDCPFGDRLTVHLTPEGPRDDLDLFAAYMPYEPQKIIAEKFGFQDYKPRNERIPDDNSPYTASGHTMSYRVRCTVSVCMQYIFVRDSGGMWRHVYTTNYAAAAELHNWYFVYWENRDLQTESSARTFCLNQYPPRFADRYADALAAYRSGTCRTNLLDCYNRIVSSPEESAVAFSLPLPCPVNTDTLRRTP